ncbi:hypothetical protein LTR53_003631 [Teratosphaeriaceae sp. CCFEE 6253]|nr:hypothetical protein LTR53_003631 [Teratosphaeriaceae sp. CCFEE 6253]
MTSRLGRRQSWRKGYPPSHSPRSDGGLEVEVKALDPPAHLQIYPVVEAVRGRHSDKCNIIIHELGKLGCKPTTHASELSCPQLLHMITLWDAFSFDKSSYELRVPDNLHADGRPATKPESEPLNSVLGAGHAGSLHDNQWGHRTASAGQIRPSEAGRLKSVAGTTEWDNLGKWSTV